MALAQTETEMDLPRLAVETAGAAKMLGLSTTWLEQLRVRGGGPAYVKIGSRVVYRIADLEGWLEANRRTDTSQRVDGRGLVT